MPGTKPIQWRGKPVDTAVIQYIAYSDGRIHEVALDWYAQADDGSVWYFGEDVFNFEDGRVADTKGSWIASDETPAAMIMPAKPAVGDVYRPENAPGVVFEQVRVEKIDQTIPGPSGDIIGAIEVMELHMDGTSEGKVSPPDMASFHRDPGRRPRGGVAGVADRQSERSRSRPIRHCGRRRLGCLRCGLGRGRRKCEASQHGTRSGVGRGAYHWNSATDEVPDDCRHRRAQQRHGRGGLESRANRPHFASRRTSSICGCCINR